MGFFSRLVYFYTKMPLSVVVQYAVIYPFFAFTNLAFESWPWPPLSKFLTISLWKFPLPRIQQVAPPLERVIFLIELSGMNENNFLLDPKNIMIFRKKLMKFKIFANGKWQKRPTELKKFSEFFKRWFNFDQVYVMVWREKIYIYLFTIYFLFVSSFTWIFGIKENKAIIEYTPRPWAISRLARLTRLTRRTKLTRLTRLIWRKKLRRLRK